MTTSRFDYEKVWAERKSPTARLVDCWHDDKRVGAFYRAHIITWADLSAYTLNQIADIGEFRLHELESLKREMIDRGVPVKSFDAFALISERTQKKLAAFEVGSLQDLTRLSEQELRQFQKLGGRVNENARILCVSPASLCVQTDLHPKSIEGLPF